MKRITLLLIVFSAIAINMSAQIGIRAGVNVSGQRINKSYNAPELTRLQFGLTYDYMPAYAKGFGLETGFLYSQKGAFESDYQTNKFKLNYVEIPLNFRYLYELGPVGFYAHTGLYAACLTNAIYQEEAVKRELQISDFSDRMDYGYNVGVGVELVKKVQIGFNWSAGFRNISHLYQGIDTNINKCRNRGFSVTVGVLLGGNK